MKYATISLSRILPHELTLIKGSIAMILGNMHMKKWLCNRTRLIVEDCHQNFVVTKILRENSPSEVATIPRIDFQPSDTNLPLILKHRQFPVLPEFAIDIKNSQVQTFVHVWIYSSKPHEVGIYLNKPVFFSTVNYMWRHREQKPRLASNCSSSLVPVKYRSLDTMPDHLQTCNILESSWLNKTAWETVKRHKPTRHI